MERGVGGGVDVASDCAIVVLIVESLSEKKVVKERASDSLPAGERAAGVAIV